MWQEVKQVGPFPVCLGGSHLLGEQASFLSQTHRCGSSVQNGLAKEKKNAEKKRTAFGEETN